MIALPKALELERQHDGWEKFKATGFENYFALFTTIYLKRGLLVQRKDFDDFYSSAKNSWRCRATD